MNPNAFAFDESTPAPSPSRERERKAKTKSGGLPMWAWLTLGGGAIAVLVFVGVVLLVVSWGGSGKGVHLATGGKPRASVEGKEWSEAQLRDYITKEMTAKGYSCKTESDSFVEIAKKADSSRVFIGKLLTPELAVKESKREEYDGRVITWGHFIISISNGVYPNKPTKTYQSSLIADIQSVLN